jgi:hypothetical protein
MKDYLSQYLSKHGESSAADTGGEELTKPTEPLNPVTEESFVSYVSAQPLEYPAIDSEVAWRVRVMLTQIPESGPIPFLVARQSTNKGLQDCLSCGESTDRNEGFICGYCSRAKNLALDLAMSFGQSSEDKVTES